MMKAHREKRTPKEHNGFQIFTEHDLEGSSGRFHVGIRKLPRLEVNL